MIRHEQRLTWYQITFTSSYKIEMNYLYLHLKAAQFRVHKITWIPEYFSWYKLYIKTRSKRLTQKHLDKIVDSYIRFTGNGTNVHLQDIIDTPF